MTSDTENASDIENAIARLAFASRSAMWTRIAVLRNQQAEMGERLQYVSERIDGLWRVTHLHDTEQLRRTATLWTRLRWLLTGR